MDAGFNQVLWLDGREQKYVEEVGAMNMMFVIDGKIVTAELGDTILPGVTRASITLAKDRDMIVEERRISVKELYEAHAEGRLTEAFGTARRPSSLLSASSNTWANRSSSTTERLDPWRRCSTIYSPASSVRLSKIFTAGSP